MIRFVFQAQDRIGKLQDIYCKYLLSYDLLPKVSLVTRVYLCSYKYPVWKHCCKLMLFVFLCVQEEKAELLQEVQTERENNASCGMFGFSPEVILYL